MEIIGYEVKERGERCSCNGEIDNLYITDSKPDIWRGRCFQCGRVFTVLYKCD